MISWRCELHVARQCFSPQLRTLAQTVEIVWTATDLSCRKSVLNSHYYQQPYNQHVDDSLASTFVL